MQKSNLKPEEKLPVHLMHGVVFQINVKKIETDFLSFSIHRIHQGWNRPLRSFNPTVHPSAIFPTKSLCSKCSSSDFICSAKNNKKYLKLYEMTSCGFFFFSEIIRFFN